MTTTQWVKISERLPPLEDIDTYVFRSFPVLLFSASAQRFDVGYYSQIGDEAITWYVQGRDAYVIHPTHWMTLPSPPKEPKP